MKCKTVPTDGVATLATHWCLTHDAPSTEDRCAVRPVLLAKPVSLKKRQVPNVDTLIRSGL